MPCSQVSENELSACLCPDHYSRAVEDDQKMIEG
jgi:hypothetical protein